jgi:hypothetical protein
MAARRPFGQLRAFGRGRRARALPLTGASWRRDAGGNAMGGADGQSRQNADGGLPERLAQAIQGQGTSGGGGQGTGGGNGPGAGGSGPQVPLEALLQALAPYLSPRAGGAAAQAPAGPGGGANQPAPIAPEAPQHLAPGAAGRGQAGNVQALAQLLHPGGGPQSPAWAQGQGGVGGEAPAGPQVPVAAVLQAVAQGLSAEGGSDQGGPSRVEMQLSQELAANLKRLKAILRETQDLAQKIESVLAESGGGGSGQGGQSGGSGPGAKGGRPRQGTGGG